MDKINSAMICKCQVYHRVDQEKLEQVIAAVQEAGISIRIADDLCYEAVHHPEKLQQTDVVIGCHKRTLAALCTYAGAERIQHVFDVDTDLQQIIESLGIASVKTDTCESCDPVPEDWVAWFPVIDQNRCVECGKCADFCMFGVYTFEEKTIKVVKPSGCKTDCPACARMCPANAIIFPKSTEANINGSLAHAVKPDAQQNQSLRARLKSRKAATQLFREDQK